jgi:hypothetical protein
VSEPAISAAFFDPEGGLHGSLRSGVGVVFRAAAPEVADEPPELVRSGRGWSARIGEASDLSFEPASEGGRLGGSTAWLCRVRGRIGPDPVECLGTVTETSRAPAWRDLDATRSISAIFGPADALFVAARRPRGASGHGEEETIGWLLDDGQLHSFEDLRLSTIYDGEGRQRSSGLELWLPGEDLPRRAAGEARAGLSLALDGLRVHAAVFGWRMDGRDGVGAYELTVREEESAA